MHRMRSDRHAMRGDWDRQGERWRGMHRHGRGGRRGMFGSEELQLVLLKLIADQPRHGYDLIREIESLSGGAYAPSPGIVYPTLTLLQDLGHIEEEKSEGARRQFAITDSGRAQLTQEAERLTQLLARLSDLAATEKKTDAAPVRRAMQNLKTALLDRLAREDAGQDTPHDIAAILDEAARKIERL